MTSPARRKFLSILFSGSALAVLPGGFAAAAPLATTALNAQTAENAFRRYVAVVEVEGELKLNADGKGVKTQPLAVTANFEFDEKVLGVAKNRATRVLRHFAKA